MALCPGMNCPKKYSCTRFLAQPLARQDFFGHSPIQNNECSYFLDVLSWIQQSLSREEVEKTAYEIYTAGSSREDLIWLITETEILIESLCKENFVSIQISTEECLLKMDKIQREDISVRAYFLSLSDHSSKQDLDWKLSETRNIFFYLHKTIKENFSNNIQNIIEWC